LPLMQIMVNGLRADGAHLAMSTVQDIAAYARWSDQVIRGDVFKYKSRLNLTGLFFVIGSAAQKTRAH
jgi:hypothetical protein